MAGTFDFEEEVTERIVDDELEEITEKYVYRTKQKIQIGSPKPQRKPPRKFSVNEFLKSANNMDEDEWEKMMYDSLLRIKYRQKEPH